MSDAMIGARLGAYDITARVGAGGMGDVYRATDTNLGREVAIKLLPAEVAADPERLGRFEREARLLASLNHPNVAHVYGFEKAVLPDGSAAHVLAMELVPREDLAERLKRGAIPVDDIDRGERRLVREIEPRDPVGVSGIDHVFITRDGQSYAYSYQQFFSDLFLVEGLR